MQHYKKDKLSTTKRIKASGATLSGSGNGWTKQQRAGLLRPYIAHCVLVHLGAYMHQNSRIWKEN